MKRAVLAVGAAILVAPAIPGEAYVPNRRQKTTSLKFDPPSAFICLRGFGRVIDAVDDENPRTYRVGDSWHELPGRVTASRAMQAGPGRQSCRRSSWPMPASDNWFGPPWTERQLGQSQLREGGGL